MTTHSFTRAAAHDPLLFAMALQALRELAARTGFEVTETYDADSLIFSKVASKRRLGVWSVIYATDGDFLATPK